MLAPDWTQWRVPARTLHRAHASPALWVSGPRLAPSPPGTQAGLGVTHPIVILIVQQQLQDLDL